MCGDSSNTLVEHSEDDPHAELWPSATAGSVLPLVKKMYLPRALVVEGYWLFTPLQWALACGL